MPCHLNQYDNLKSLMHNSNLPEVLGLTDLCVHITCVASAVQQLPTLSFHFEFAFDSYNL